MNQNQEGNIEVQYLRPDRIIEERDGRSLIFLPIGLLEWHGPHLPLGVDPLRARSAAIELARTIGGIVMPTLYCGTERERTPEMLESIGFGGDEYVVGMDFPSTTLRSHYFDEGVFGVVLREQLRLLVDAWQFRNVVVVNGHGAENHLAAIGRLSTEFTRSRNAKVFMVMPMHHFPDHGWGHATLEETETLEALLPDTVDVDLLPPKPAPLRNLDWAIVDDAGFRGGAPAVGLVCAEEDPRNSNSPRGKTVWDETIRRLAEIIEAKLRDD